MPNNSIVISSNQHSANVLGTYQNILSQLLGYERSLREVDYLHDLTQQEVVSNRSDSLKKFTGFIASVRSDLLVVNATQEFAVRSFDSLQWTLDLTANSSSVLLYLLDTTGLSYETIVAEIQTVVNRARHSCVTLAGILLCGALNPSFPKVTSTKVYRSPLNSLELAEVVSTRAAAVTPLVFRNHLMRDAARNPKTIVLPEADDDRILLASSQILQEGVANLILSGSSRERIEERAKELGLNLSGVQVVNPNQPELVEKYAKLLVELRAHKGMTLDKAISIVENDISFFATLMVKAGDADGMVSGAVHTTADTLRPALQVVKTKPGVSTVSSAFLMLLKDQVLVIGDCAVNIDPSAQQLADTALESARTAAAFGLDPRVALLSYSTLGSGSGPSVDKVTEATALAKQAKASVLSPELADRVEIDGPLQFDAAVSPVVAQQKAPNSPVAGRANVLIAPDLNSGNISYKAIQRTSGAVAVGPVLQGLAKPVNDLSRGATVEDIVNTVAITVLQG